MSKILIILFLIAGCATTTTSEISRSIAVDESLKGPTDAALELIQSELYLLPIHVLKEVRWGTLPRTELAECVAVEGGVVLTINNGYRHLIGAQLEALVRAAIFQCLAPRQKDPQV